MDTIHTQRLILKGYSEADRENFVALFTNETVMKHVDTGAMDQARVEQFWHKVISRNTTLRQELRAAFKQSTAEYIGNATIVESHYLKGELEIGFILNEQHWGNGFATEIAKALIEYCFETLGVEKVFATVDDDNYPSIKVLKKTGMNFLRYEFDNDGRFSIYSIARED